MFRTASGILITTHFAACGYKTSDPDRVEGSDFANKVDAHWKRLTGGNTRPLCKKCENVIAIRL